MNDLDTACQDERTLIRKEMVGPLMEHLPSARDVLGHMSLVLTSTL